ncbi:MAG: glycoside hydrolase family 127 protein [Clostridiales bacterium]|nr:glycoside hydrolase family 127 protein [Clostridiales bacterium]
MEKIKNSAFTHVKFMDGFWKDRYELNRDVSLRAVYDRFEETGRFNALRFHHREGKSDLHIFYDSDVAKWIEAVGYLIENGENLPEEEKIIDALILDMEKNQLPDGYINSYFIQIAPSKRFTDRNCHELYCAGHLIEGAIAYDRATGKSKLLDIMKRYVDCIERYFVTEKIAAYDTCGHEEIELALVKLFEHTGDKKYLNLALYFINARGVSEKDESLSKDWNKKYDQSEIPLRNLSLAEGHAVRAVYLYIGMAEVALKTQDPELLDACRRVWRDIVDRKMYVTGGIGSGKTGEAFTSAYDLPNLEAYSESCAAIGLALFALSMQKAELNAEYGAVIERIMYNGLLSSTSLDGKAFFYENPLEIHLASVGKETSILPHRQIQLPSRHRSEVFGCSCCPPNINRIFARVGDFFFSRCGNAFVINQYAAVDYNDGAVSFTMKTEYPNDGKITLQIHKCDCKELLFRIPEWCEEYVVSTEYMEKQGYIAVSAGEKEISVEFKMKPYFVQCNPLARANVGRVALCYGPTVYCLERLDNDFELNAISIDTDTEIAVGDVSAEYGMRSLKANAYLDQNFGALYRKVKGDEKTVSLTFRPYYSFANREECDMLIWLRRK